MADVNLNEVYADFVCDPSGLSIYVTIRTVTQRATQNIWKLLKTLTVGLAAIFGLLAGFLEILEKPAMETKKLPKNDFRDQYLGTTCKDSDLAQTAEANLRAAEANLVLAQLRSRLVDRVLTRPLQTTIAIQLKPLESTPEILTFAKAIAGTLVNAGWALENTGNALSIVLDGRDALNIGSGKDSVNQATDRILHLTQGDRVLFPATDIFQKLNFELI